MKTAIDFYSGIGGWTLGMKLSGIEHLHSFEWWDEANETHNINFNTTTKEIDIRKLNVKTDLKFKKKIDFIVGSPPCTQFSLSNRGGSGDIKDGLVDIHKFLEVIDYLKPKYWVMENVPRVAGILENELNDGVLKKYKKLVKVITVVDSSEYGLPQSRERMISGDFPLSLFESYKSKISTKTLGDVLKLLNKKTVIDPNYGYKIDKNTITECENEPDLTASELRINRDSKENHPIYNKMSFPDRVDRPSRTITATCTRISRESIIIESNSGYRRLNVRERGVLQGFPITYQFYGKSINSKFKMIGNAIPPILTYYLFQSMLETPLSKLKTPHNSVYNHKKPQKKSIENNLISISQKKYSKSRKFQFVIPGLRFGSGVRFELSNSISNDLLCWSIKFFYGSSKNIYVLPLNDLTLKKTSSILTEKQIKIFEPHLKEFREKFYRLNSEYLQNL
jgi:DNA (cytosine-5)-methyltransferase 1